jgi:uncharacterized membrane protein
MVALILLVTASLAAAPRLAHAEFRVCNQTLNLVNIAVGAEFEQVFKTEGWWTVPANSCVSPIKDDLQERKIRFVYVYLMGIEGQDLMKGDWDMCVRPEKFVFTKPPKEPWDCWVKGYQIARFTEIDTANSKNWTVFFREAAGVTTLAP